LFIKIHDSSNKTNYKQALQRNRNKKCVNEYNNSNNNNKLKSVYLLTNQIDGKIQKQCRHILREKSSLHTVLISETKESIENVE
jgi:hypothetical protein